MPAVLGPRHQFLLGLRAFPLFLFYKPITGAIIVIYLLIYKIIYDCVQQTWPKSMQPEFNDTNGSCALSCENARKYLRPRLSNR